MICRKEKFIFIHVPKTGGTSIEKALITPDCELISNTHGKGFILNHLTLEQMADFSFATVEEFHEYFVFGFVRHPYDRTISGIHYLNFIDGMKGRSFDQQFDYFMSMENFGNHVIPQVSFFQGHWQAVNFIGRYESLELDFKKILHGIGRDSHVPDV
ncbi:MAG: sulfotransferase family 2 domain-containing protein [Bacteroidota bacterium]